MPVRPQTDVFTKRSSLLTVFLLILYFVAAFRLFSMQVVDGAENRKLAENQHSVYRKLSPSRGKIEIVDSNTLETFPLATNIQKYLVYAVPPDVANPKLTAEILATALDLPALEILEKISKVDRKYVPLKKELTETEQDKIKELKLSGIYLDSEDARFYPEKNLLSQTLGFYGYKGDQKVGLYGLERYFEKELAGKSGELREENDPTGAWIYGSTRELVPALDGTNLVLTIDKTIQFKAESVLEESVIRHGADGGSVIVLNPKTGAVLALANYPDFDPNLYNKVEDPKLFSNPALTANFEPGSTFKAITMAASLDAGKITPETTYTDTGSLVIDKYTIKNSDGKAHGVQTMTQALGESLNTGAIFAKDQIGNPEFLKYLKKFGFGSPTGIELPEMKGNIDNLRTNILVNYATASFGQGISVTPIQMVQAYSALANGGKMMKPFIVQTKIKPDGYSETTKPQVVAEVISAKAANMVTAMLVDVVENGHGKRAGVPGYYIAGKTGTAQVPRKDGKPGYEENNNIGSFIGYGPVDDPKFLMMVKIDHPRDVKYAESTAAPTFGELAQFILSYLHIPTTR